MTADIPHIIQEPDGGPEQARVLGTGMHVWEIVWVARNYPDLSAMADSLDVDRSLLEEGMRYAAEYPSEVAVAIQHIDSVTLDDFRALLPGMKVATFDPDAPPDAPS
ncbi:MAG: hypothetical protein ACR2JC_01250 [Chloroflexota bacterium]